MRQHGHGGLPMARQIASGNENQNVGLTALGGDGATGTLESFIKRKDARPTITEFLTPATSEAACLLENHADLTLNAALLHVVRRAQMRERERRRVEPSKLSTHSASVDRLVAPDGAACAKELTCAKGSYRRPRGLLKLAEAGWGLRSPGERGSTRLDRLAQKQQQRSILLFLRRIDGIEPVPVGSDDHSCSSRQRRLNIDGTMKQTAAQIAKATESEPWGGGKARREERQIQTARQARSVLRGFRASASYYDSQLYVIQRATHRRESSVRNSGCHASQLNLEHLSFGATELDQRFDKPGSSPGNSARSTDTSLSDSPPSSEPERSCSSTVQTPGLLDRDHTTGREAKLCDGVQGDYTEPLSTERTERWSKGSSRSKPPTSRRAVLVGGGDEVATFRHKGGSCAGEAEELPYERSDVPPPPRRHSRESSTHQQSSTLGAASEVVRVEGRRRCVRAIEQGVDERYVKQINELVEAKRHEIELRKQRKAAADEQRRTEWRKQTAAAADADEGASAASCRGRDSEAPVLLRQRRNVLPSTWDDSNPSLASNTSTPSPSKARASSGGGITVINVNATPEGIRFAEGRLRNCRVSSPVHQSRSTSPQRSLLPPMPRSAAAQFVQALRSASPNVVRHASPVLTRGQLVGQHRSQKH